MQTSVQKHISGQEQVRFHDFTIAILCQPNNIIGSSVRKKTFKEQNKSIISTSLNSQSSTSAKY
jgi:hypothetical protein